jgi:hypothetical protein
VLLQQLIFPSLYALERSSPVVFIKSIEDFLLYNFSHSLCSELHLETLILLAPVVSLQYLIGSYGYSCTISICPHAIFVLQILPIPCLYSTVAHPFTTPIQVKIGCQSLSPCCISLPLSGSSSILPSRNHSHRIYLLWRNHHSIRSLIIRNPTVPLCRHPASLQQFHYKLLHI